MTTTSQLEESYWSIIEQRHMQAAKQGGEEILDHFDRFYATDSQRGLALTYLLLLHCLSGEDFPAELEPAWESNIGEYVDLSLTSSKIKIPGTIYVEETTVFVGSESSMILQTMFATEKSPQAAFLGKMVKRIGPARGLLPINVFVKLLNENFDGDSSLWKFAASLLKVDLSELEEFLETHFEEKSEQTTLLDFALPLRYYNSLDDVLLKSICYILNVSETFFLQATVVAQNEVVLVPKRCSSIFRIYAASRLIQEGIVEAASRLSRKEKRRAKKEIIPKTLCALASIGNRFLLRTFETLFSTSAERVFTTKNLEKMSPIISALYNAAPKSVYHELISRQEATIHLTEIMNILLQIMKSEELDRLDIIRDITKYLRQEAYENHRYGL